MIPLSLQHFHFVLNRFWNPCCVYFVSIHSYHHRHHHIYICKYVCAQIQFYFNFFFLLVCLFDAFFRLFTPVFILISSILSFIIYHLFCSEIDDLSVISTKSYSKLRFSKYYYMQINDRLKANENSQEKFSVRKNMFVTLVTLLWTNSNTSLKHQFNLWIIFCAIYSLFFLMNTFHLFFFFFVLLSCSFISSFFRLTEMISTQQHPILIY